MNNQESAKKLVSGLAKTLSFIWRYFPLMTCLFAIYKQDLILLIISQAWETQNYIDRKFDEIKGNK